MPTRQYDFNMYREFMATQLPKALRPAEVKANPPLRYWPDVDDYTMSCGMDITPAGRVWLAWFAGGDNEDAVVILAYSDDSGMTFSKPQFILDPGYADCGIHLSAVVANLWTAPDGRLFLFFTQSLGYFDGRSGSWFSVCENPDSEQPTWSAPVRIWHGASLNKPTVLSNGTWLLPISLWPANYEKIEKKLQDPKGPRFNFFSELEDQRGVNIFASRDMGKTWERIGHVRNARELSTFDEPMIVERKDGSLLMYTRITNGTTQSISTDGGRTWTTPERTSFTNASARFFIRKLQSGNLLLIRHANPDAPLERSFMTAYISKDDGRTWLGGLLLDERKGISYPDGFQTSDGRIHIQYDYKRECGEILMAVFKEEDVLAGKNVSGFVLLKHPVVQSFTAKNTQ